MRQAETGAVLYVAGGGSRGGGMVYLGHSFARVLNAYRQGWRVRWAPGDVLNIHFALYGAPFLAGVLVRRLVEVPRRRGWVMPPVVVHFHGPWSDESRIAGAGGRVNVRAKRVLELFVLRRARRVVVLSEVFRRTVVEGFRTPASKVVVLRPGIDESWFAEPDGATSVSDDLELLSVRRLTPRMGHLRLLDSLHRLGFRAEGRPIRLHLVGVGDEAEAIRAWIDEHRMHDSVTLHGSISDEEVRDIGRRCTAAVIPTLEFEGFGLVVVEAMAMGLPVISTGQGGLREAMGPWAHTPFIFSIDDPTSLAEAMSAARRMSEAPASRTELRDYARTFRWSSVATTLTDMVGAAG